jgi:hypothetical protein
LKIQDRATKGRRQERDSLSSIVSIFHFNLTMKIAATLSLVIASASAFAPSQQGAKSAASLEAVTDMNGLVGPDIECGNQVFDPLGVTQYASGDYLRKAELSNGRTAMLAVGM